MRIAMLAAVLFLIAGCGSSTASGTTPTPSPASPTTQSWSRSPALTINRNAQYLARVTTNDGSFTIQLLPNVAPIAANNFVFLARHHFYDGNAFWRVLAGFMVQTGDPTGTGFGGPGYRFKDEKVTMPYSRGTLAMANSGANTNGSQFFIIAASAGHPYPLAKKYTIFGHVISGMNVVQRISQTPVAPQPSGGELSAPIDRVYIKTVTIQEKP